VLLILCLSFMPHYPATYYAPDDQSGACGNSLQNADFIVALAPPHWDDGAHCGLTVNVKYQDGSIQVVVQNLCPDCYGGNGIDLSEGAMAVLDSNYVNNVVIPVVWSF
ncbi:RlpA-like double-psi beta-barrel-protein domain-containing protein-containing protein, partial [Mycena galopus ATCC 62051]